jgi:hypothetical protein
MPGPAPKAEAARRRRNATVATTRLPAEGYNADIPEWPLFIPMTIREEILWGELWRTPVAAQWIRQRYTRMVGLYVRYHIMAEEGDWHAAAETRHLADRLGLTPMAQLRLRWEIAEDEVGEARADKAAAKAPARKPRLRAVDNG